MNVWYIIKDTGHVSQAASVNTDWEEINKAGVLIGVAILGKFCFKRYLSNQLST